MSLLAKMDCRDAPRATLAAETRLRLEPGERWYVAMTLPHKERLAAANLANQRYRCFLPLQLATRRHARQFRTELAPVFPRYLFVILHVERMRWRSVNGTIGVQSLISEGERPLAAPPGVVETLIQSSDARGALSYRAEDLAVGDGAAAGGAVRGRAGRPATPRWA